MSNLSRSVRPSLVTEKSAVGHSNHHCGVDPRRLISIILRNRNLKQAFLTHRYVIFTMGVMEFLFAPRKDHRGWSTPSEAKIIFHHCDGRLRLVFVAPFSGQCNRIFMRFNVNFNTTTFLRLVVNITSQQWV